MLKKSLFWLPLAGILVLTAGCGAQAGPSSSDVQAYNKQRNIDPSKVNQFLTELAAVPPAQRRDFVNQHPDDMRVLGQTQDPAIQSRFRQIVSGR